MERSASAASAKIQEQLQVLPSALPCLELKASQPDEVVERTHGNLSFCEFMPYNGWESGLMLIGTLPLTELQLVCVKTTPLRLKHLDNGQVCVGLCYAGSISYQEHSRQVSAVTGDLLLCPNDGGFLTTSLCSSIVFQFQPKRLLRTLAVMLGYEDGSFDLSQSHSLSTDNSSVSRMTGGLMRDVCAFIDTLLQEDEVLPEVMGLEEQCFRCLALEWLNAHGQLDVLRRRRRHSQRQAFLDELVDFILANLDRPITLTELEEQSNYSGRQLQYMFRRKFNCTPMQFVRRQRLQFAMTRLEQAHPSDTITAIARGLGYRNTSSFSSDFYRHFGTYPSAILRSNRQRAATPHAPASPSSEADTESTTPPRGEGIQQPPHP